jgi:hypothetical protein
MASAADFYFDPASLMTAAAGGSEGAAAAAASIAALRSPGNGVRCLKHRTH